MVDAKNIKSLVLWQLRISTHGTGQIRVLHYIMKVNEAPLPKRSKNVVTLPSCGYWVTFSQA